MVAAVLVLYGAVLFVNAFFLLGRTDGRPAGPIGAFSIVWAIVFALFAANLAFSRAWAKITGYAAIFTSFATLMLPGYWLLMGGSLP